MPMDILVIMPMPSKGISVSSNLSNRYNYSSLFSPSFRTFCSRKGSQQPQPNDDKDKNAGDKSSIDWDRAWTSFKKQGKKSFSSNFSPNKYVSWNPRRSNYPLSEEVDPIKRAEKSNLMLWTSPRFTLGGAIAIVSLLLIYTILAPMK